MVPSTTAARLPRAKASGLVARASRPTVCAARLNPVPPEAAAGSFDNGGATATCKANWAGCKCTPTGDMCGNAQPCENGGCAGKFLGSVAYPTCTGNYAGCRCKATDQTCGNPRTADPVAARGAGTGGLQYGTCTGNYVGCKCKPSAVSNCCCSPSRALRFSNMTSRAPVMARTAATQTVVQESSTTTAAQRSAPITTKVASATLHRYVAQPSVPTLIAKKLLIPHRTPVLPLTASTAMRVTAVETTSQDIRPERAVTTTTAASVHGER